jgi:hypothetical protein
MRPLRYSINVTLDGCCDHREMIADEDLHRHAMENIVQADALLFGRVTYEMMEAAWRLSTRTVAMPDWTEPFARTIDAAKKYVVSSTPGPGRLECGTHPRGSGTGRKLASMNAAASLRTKLGDQIFTSSNPLISWLRQVDTLRSAS